MDSVLSAAARLVEQIEQDSSSFRGLTDTESCHLLAGTFAMVLQSLIGFFALCTLMYKRLTETPRRPWDIWLMDVSKQAVSSVFIHFWNIGLSILFAHTILDGIGLTGGSDECSFYFLSFLFDTILGVFFVWVVLKCIRRFAIYFKIESIAIQGYYGEPVSMQWYFNQLFCFLLAVVTSKVVLSLIMFSIAVPLQYIGTFIFSPLELNPKMELVIVMIVCPCCLNVIQYWLLDNILSDKNDSSGSRCRDYEFLEDSDMDSSDHNSPYNTPPYTPPYSNTPYTGVYNGLSPYNNTPYNSTSPYQSSSVYSQQHPHARQYYSKQYPYQSTQSYHESKVVGRE